MTGKHVLDDGILVGNFAAGLDDRVLGLVDDRVGSSWVVEPNNGRLGLVNTENAWNKGQGGGEEGVSSHVDDLEGESGPADWSVFCRCESAFESWREVFRCVTGQRVNQPNRGGNGET